MKIPEFTAEASLYQTGSGYHSAGALEAMRVGNIVCPQIQFSLIMGRRPTGPFGPIGLPGQNCEQACWHVCASVVGGSGLFRERCMQNCLAGCVPNLTRF